MEHIFGAFFEFRAVFHTECVPSRAVGVTHSLPGSEPACEGPCAELGPGLFLRTSRQPAIPCVLYFKSHSMGGARSLENQILKL
jgi:hypothetical protein